MGTSEQDRADRHHNASYCEDAHTAIAVHQHADQKLRDGVDVHERGSQPGNGRGRNLQLGLQLGENLPRNRYTMDIDQKIDQNAHGEEGHRPAPLTRIHRIGRRRCGGNIAAISAGWITSACLGHAVNCSANRLRCGRLSAATHRESSADGAGNRAHGDRRARWRLRRPEPRHGRCRGHPRSHRRRPR